MTAGSPWLASDQGRALIERVAVFVVERYHGALLPRKPAVTAIEVQIGVRGCLPLDVDGVGEPQAWQQAPP
jgi:hypothetical protein